MLFPDRILNLFVLFIMTGLADLTPALHHMNSDVSEDDVFMVCT